MNVQDMVKDLCRMHMTIINLNDEEYYDNWIEHDDGLPDDPDIETLCQVSDDEYFAIGEHFKQVIVEYAERYAHDYTWIGHAMKTGKIEGNEMYENMIEEMLVGLSY